MKNYLDKMVIKPDYVVVYNEDGTYDCKIMSDNNFHGIYISGYAASKSHPDEPVLISINIPSNGNLKDVSVSKLNSDTYLREVYTGKHDLFVYKLAKNAILAGKEMALYDEADRYVDMYKDVADPIIGHVKSVINNPLYRRMGQGFIELLTQEFEKRKNDFEPIVNSSKDKAKDAYNKAKNTVKTGVDKLFNEIKNPNKKDDPFWCETEQCALYRELTKECAVMLKHRKNFAGSKFTITIFKLNLGQDKIYTITQEMFRDIYNILNANEDGYLTFNSIMDVIADVVNDDIKQSNTKKDVEKPSKTHPIQMVEFKPQDIVKSEPRFVNKFKVGDKVVVKTGGLKGTHGVIDEIIRHQCDSGTKTKYLVRFGSKLNDHVSNYKEFYSYQLDKYVEPKKDKKEYTTPVTKPAIKIVNDAITDIHIDLNKKLQEHDEVINKIWNFLNDLKNNK